jgi:hypothetical protein
MPPPTIDVVLADVLGDVGQTGKEAKGHDQSGEDPGAGLGRSDASPSVKTSPVIQEDSFTCTDCGAAFADRTRLKYDAQRLA